MRAIALRMVDGVAVRIDELSLWAGPNGVVIYVGGAEPQLVAFRDVYNNEENTDAKNSRSWEGCEVLDEDWPTRRVFVANADL